MENAVTNVGHRLSRNFLRLACVCIVIAATGGCITHPGVRDVFPDHLDQIAAGTRVTVQTRDGETVKMRVTAADAETLAGVDRHYRSYQFHPDELTDVSLSSQNDTIVMLAWVAVVFATGL